MKNQKSYILTGVMTPIQNNRRLFTLLYLVLCLLILLVQFFLADSWMKLPFIGGFMEKGLVFNEVTVLNQPAGWPVYEAGVDDSVQLTEIDGQLVNTPQDFIEVISEYAPGEQVNLSTRSISTGEERTFEITLIQFPFEDRYVYFYLPFFVAAVFLLCAFWLLFSKKNSYNSRIFSLALASIAVVLGGAFDLYTTQRLVLVWLIEVLFMGAALFDFVLNFPYKDRLLLKYPLAQILVYFPPFLVLIAALVFYVPSDTHNSYIIFRDFCALVSGLYLLAAMGWLPFRRLKDATMLEKEQIWLIVLSGAAAFAPAVIWYLKLVYSPYLIISLVIFPIIVSYTIYRYQLVQTGYVLSKGMVYGILVILIGVSYALIVSGLEIVFIEYFDPESPIFVGLIFFVFALLFNPLRNRIERFVDSVFFKGKLAFQVRMQNFASDLTKVVGLLDIIQLIRKYVNEPLRPKSLHIFIFDPLSDQYVATMDEMGEITSDIRFSINSPFVKVLEKQHSPFFLRDSPILMEKLKQEQSRINLLESKIFVPFPGQDQLLGWLALSDPEDGSTFSPKEYEFLESISDQAALALERAQVVANLEDRVREMNVLARIAQGINITLELDDILELIYAQTTQIISADDFHIFLIDVRFMSVVQIFCVENNERLRLKENKPGISDNSLEKVVMNMGRALQTSDFIQECKKHNIVSDENGLFAWMGVPLNSGADVIGALSLGKRESQIVYTQQQLSLLRAIADQVAGAIIKARLLEETQWRARQLTSLNEISRQLSSNLEFEPLINNILNNAVQLLDCEAGCLELVDEDTDDLIFRVFFGSHIEDLINKRAPSTDNLAGKVLLNHRAMIINNVQNLNDWFNWLDVDSKYGQDNLLIVPVELKDKPIGVIEVINKKDSSHFSKDDEQLLSSFASQAAVAIENARLYTMTDQELTSRIEELSIMQRISRELNTTLEIVKAMQITLDWTLRLSKAEAGYIGILTEDRLQLQISTRQGYRNNELDEFSENAMSLNQSFLLKIIESGSPQIISGRYLDDTGKLKNVQSLVAIPIRRENTSTGLLVLESVTKNHFSEANVDFLQRIMDHASIAITNAQLYSAVQRASVAKSEFVSFVSHELKNPMTSIKGYAELLAAGAVGQISEPQMNFLKTILTNVDRMATLVSDLADESRIEAGRLRLDFESQDPYSILDEVVRSEKRMIEEKKQNLLIQMPEDLPHVWADRTRLVQILSNLISNSRKYTQDGGQILVSAQIEADSKNKSGQILHFWVKDNGYGIDEENQKKIFQKFYRVEDIRAREVSGTGLGLNITKSLVEAMGGDIWFESVMNQGSTFHFTMPVAEQ